MNYTGRPSISGCRPVLSLYPTHRFCQYLLLIFITFTNSFLFNRAFSTNSRSPLSHAAGVTALDSTSPSALTRCHCPGCGSQRLLRCRSHPAGRGPNSSSLFPPLAAVVAVAPTEGRLWQAASFPVSFWRIICYNGFAVHPAYLTGEEVDALAYFLTFLVSVGADVVSHFICKWLDRCEENRKA